MFITRSLDRDDDPFSVRRRLNTYRSHLDLREHDLDRLYAASEATLRLLLTLIEAGHISAAKK